MTDTGAAAGSPSHMVASRVADASAILGVIRNTQHVNALHATTPTFSWSPRDGRNAQYAQFEEHLRSVARQMGIPYEQIGNTAAPVIKTATTGIATRNTAALQQAAADDEEQALAQWQIEATRLFEHAVRAVTFEGLSCVDSAQL